MHVHARVLSIYNLKGFRVGLVAGLGRSRHSVCVYARVCVHVRARAFLVMHAHMCSGPIGLVTALQSAILIMQHFIKSSR